MTSALPSSIPDSQLGLSHAEIQILRQHQQIALQSQAYAHSISTRGRGHARTSASTSRAASAASSGHGRLVLDPGSLAVLGQHFERLMGAIQNRVEQVCQPDPSLQITSQITRRTPPEPGIQHLRVGSYGWTEADHPTPLAHSTNSNLNHQPVLARRRCDGCRRRRNCPLPGHNPTDR